MRKLTWLVAVFFLPGFALAQSDDYDFANALAERGWYDLAEEIFVQIQNDGSLQADRRAEGKYGLARMKMLQAERETDAEKKMKTYETAIQQINEFIEKFPSHPRRGEALGDIGYLYQSKGKYLMGRSKADPAQAKKAEASFEQAEKLFWQQIESLKPKRPADPSTPQYEVWDQKMMYAKYNYGVSLFSHAETYRDIPEKHDRMVELLVKMNKFFINDFMWEYEWYLLAYDAFIYMGRGYEIMALTAKDDKTSKEHWRDCFSYVGKAKGLLDKKENRKNEGVREIASRAVYFEIKARLVYGGTLSGGAAKRQYEIAAKITDQLFRSIPDQRKTNMGKAILIEQARAYCMAGQLEKGRDRLNKLSAANPETWVEDLCIDIMGEYLAEKDPGIAVRAAENLRLRGVAYLFRAIQKYRRALANLRPGSAEEAKYAPKCWYGIGWCYYYQNRYYEAVAALDIFDKNFQTSPESVDAAFLKLSALRRIDKITDTAETEKAFQDYRDWVTNQPHLAKRLGDATVRDAAVELEHEAQNTFRKKDWKGAAEKFGQAAQKWQQIAKPGGGYFEEAIFSMGFNHYQEGQAIAARMNDPALVKRQKEQLAAEAKTAYTAALDAFRRHLEYVEKPSTERTDRVIKHAIGSILFSVKTYASEVMDQPKKALEVSDKIEERFPKADPMLVIAIMRSRIEARIGLGEIQAAETDLRALKARYEKEQLGGAHYMSALGALAGAFRERSETEQDPELRRIFQLKSAKYTKQYMDLNPDSGDQDQQEAMADILFQNAEQTYDVAKSKGDEESLKEAQNLYKQAGEMYDQIFARVGDILGEPQRKAYLLRMARCEMRSGGAAAVDKAITRFEELTAEDVSMRDGSTWEALADAYMEKAMGLETGGERTRLVKKADDVYARLSSMLLVGQKQNEHFFRLLFKHADALLKYDHHQLERFFQSMDARGYGPKWDENEAGKSQWGFRDRLEAIRKEAEKYWPDKKEGDR